MPPALTPSLALDYVRELSADVRAGVVLDGDGALLAGPPELAPAARELLAAAGGAEEFEAVSSAGVVCAVRSGSHALVAVCGRFALPGLTRQDLRVALRALAGAGAPGPDLPSTPDPALREAADAAAPGTADAALQAAAEALISALQRHSDA